MMFIVWKLFQYHSGAGWLSFCEKKKYSIIIAYIGYIILYNVHYITNKFRHSSKFFIVQYIVLVLQHYRSRNAHSLITDTPPIHDFATVRVMYCKVTQPALMPL